MNLLTFGENGMDLYNELFPEDCQWGEEKVASRAMDYFGIRFDERVEKIAGIAEMTAAAKNFAGKAKGKFLDYHRSIGKNLSDMRTGAPEKVRVKNPGKKGPKTKMMETKLTPGERVKSGLTAGAKMLPHAALLGGAGYGTYRAFSGKKK